MGKNSKNKKTLGQSMGSLFPPELTNASAVQIIGGKELTLDGCRGILEYSDFSVKIRTTDGAVTISGQNLNIKYISVNSVVIEGGITCVEFEKQG